MPHSGDGDGALWHSSAKKKIHTEQKCQLPQTPEGSRPVPFLVMQPSVSCVPFHDLTGVFVSLPLVLFSLQIATWHILL
jgi:hypothetical protein